MDAFRERLSLVELVTLCTCVAAVVSGCRDSVDQTEQWEFGPRTAEGIIVDQPVPSPSCGGSPPERCSRLQHQIWPVAADTDQCQDSGGEPHNATGEGAANWFRFGGCGSIKEYEVDSCSWVRIDSHGDACDSCLLWHVDYAVEQKKGDDWEKIADVDPPDRRGMEHEICVQIATERFRIRARDGFYVDVYER